MAEWIDCGLPFSRHDLKYPEEPDFTEEIKSLFGVDWWPLRHAQGYLSPTDFVLRQLVMDWYEKQPLVQEMRNQSAALYSESFENTFCSQGLNRVGVLVETEKGHRFLIGDMDCDGCWGESNTVHDVIVQSETIITRYMLLDLPQPGA